MTNLTESKMTNILIVCSLLMNFFMLLVLAQHIDNTEAMLCKAEEDAE
jgi:hypothetical protein